MKKPHLVIIIVAVVVLAVIGKAVWWTKHRPTTTNQANSTPTVASIYDPQIIPTEFSASITNPMFSLPVGRKLTFQAETEDGTEKIEIEIESGTKVIMGVTTTIYRDRVYIDGQLVEDTRDYLAQHQNGDVWYFGEEVDNYEDGTLVDHAGSFIAGVNGAQPGIWIKGTHVPGDSYRQEYAPGEAEDMRDVVAVDLTLTTKRGTYRGCVQMYDWTPLDPESREYKYYCPEDRALVLVEDMVSEKRTELVGAE